EAAKTTGSVGHNAIASALTATAIAPSATRDRFDRMVSSSSPPGSWLNRPARPPTLRTKPMLCCVQFSSARKTATNGPNPACIPARKKFPPAGAPGLVPEGDEPIASDDTVTAMVFTSAGGARTAGIRFAPGHDSPSAILSRRERDASAKHTPFQGPGTLA